MKILIWGTGYMTQYYLSEGELKEEELIGFIESNPTGAFFEGKKIYRPEEAAKLEYDFIFVMVSFYAGQIMESARKAGLLQDRMIFMDIYDWSCVEQPVKKLTKTAGQEQNEIKVQSCFPKLANHFLNQGDGFVRKCMVTFRNAADYLEKTSMLQQKEFQGLEYQMNYFRYRTFELSANEIIQNRVPGAVAELGVFRGEFSKMINAKFPDRRMYLFDTFASFDEEEFRSEVSEGRCMEDFIDIFRQTSEETVLNKMLFPGQCVIKKGYFPQTAQGLEDETFAFVSVDVDLEQSIYEGLKFFYPRLNEGGAIFVHDYNNCQLFGVKAAVARYEKEAGRMKKIPIADESGTLIIVK